MANINSSPKRAKDLLYIKNNDDAMPIHGVHLRTDIVEPLTDGTSTNLKVDTGSFNTISEATAGSGVTIDNVLLRDGSVEGATIPSEVITAANTITAAESGKTFYLNSETGSNQTLPAPALGLKFKFVITTVPTSGNMVVKTPSADDNLFYGSVDVNSTLVLAAGEDSINFIASTCIIGDWISVESDGTNWYITGQSGAAGGITATT